MTTDVARVDRAILLAESADEDEWHIDEMKALARTAGVKVAGVFFSRSQRRPGQSFISADRLGELYNDVVEKNINVVLVASDLSPSEHATIFEALNVRVVDRTQLILDIFAQRAHTREGNLQVELAQLTYLLPRLSGSGTEMSRLGGGVGTRGPGETKLESDRRRLRKKITSLTNEIDTIRRHREVARAARRKLPFPSAALVGYTSAGKSTLLNTLSGSEVAADAKLFSTLDPTTRRVVLPDGWAILVTDTVGFIRNLPHQLIAAFRATLEEVGQADILIHVVDASAHNSAEQVVAVNDTLEAIGVHDKPTVMVYNKSDLVRDTYDLRMAVANKEYACYISAAQKEGIHHLISKMSEAITSLLVDVVALIPYERSDLVSECYEVGRVSKAEYTEHGIRLEARVARSFAGNLTPFFDSDGAAG